ncbi:SAM-dependent methyltransferase [Thalassiella azotivora]
MDGRRPWRVAWDDALYGGDGFYRRPEGPAGHFRTASHAAAVPLGRALARLARAAGCTSVVDVGAGRGELLRGVATADPTLRLAAVERADAPPGWPSQVAWTDRLPEHLDDALVVGWELLDVVPCTVLEVDGDGVAREVLVGTDGSERLGGGAAPEDLAWCDRWWPLDAAEPGDRVEVGRTRDELWRSVVDRLGSGVALAVDYAHDHAARPAPGTLTGYRRGQQVLPVPDGACDLTAHVALDAVAAGLTDGATAPVSRSRAPASTVSVPTVLTVLTVLTTQRQALRALGVDAARPPLAVASSDPAGYLAGLSAAGEAAELLDPGGLGGFGWLLHAVGAPAVEGVAGLLGT